MVIYVCLGVSMLSLFLRLYFEIVPTVWYILFLILSCHICVFRIAVYYQTRRVSGHICVLGLHCFTRPGE